MSNPDIKTHMLRSSTPAANEKVLLYLESLESNPPEENDGASRASSVRSGSRVRSRARSSAAGTTRKLEELTEEGVDGEGEGGEDIRSDIQEGGSEVARTVAIHTIGVEHEPGPNDPPGPKFESYGSSFGNFGPLPPDNVPIGANGWHAPKSPTRLNGALPPGSPTESHHNPFQQWGMTPATAAGIPLPKSIKSVASATSVGVGIEPPSSPGVSRSRHNASRASNKSPPPVESVGNGVRSPILRSRLSTDNRPDDVAQIGISCAFADKNWEYCYGYRCRKTLLASYRCITGSVCEVSANPEDESYRLSASPRVYCGGQFLQSTYAASSVTC